MIEKFSRRDKYNQTNYKETDKETVYYCFLDRRIERTAGPMHGLLYLRDGKLLDIVYLMGKKRHILIIQCNDFILL